MANRKYKRMILRNIKQGAIAFFILSTLLLTGCQTGNAPDDATNATTTQRRSLAPERVDIRGSIIRSQYDQGQVMLEVEGIPSPSSRYNRAFVLVEPTTQIIGLDGRSISLSELRQGQNVAIFLRSGGQGNIVGLGVARKVWLEEVF